MSKLIVYMSMSLDGFIAAVDDGPGRGLGVGGEPLHAWLTDGNTNPASFRPECVVNAEIFGEMMASGAVLRHHPRADPPRSRQAAVRRTAEDVATEARQLGGRCRRSAPAIRGSGLVGSRTAVPLNADSPSGVTRNGGCIPVISAIILLSSTTGGHPGGGGFSEGQCGIRGYTRTRPTRIRDRRPRVTVRLLRSAAVTDSGKSYEGELEPSLLVAVHCQLHLHS
jgi:hypothetical protein